MRKPRLDEALGALVGLLTGLPGVAIVMTLDSWVEARRARRLLRGERR